MQVRRVPEISTTDPCNPPTISYIQASRVAVRSTAPTVIPVAQLPTTCSSDPTPPDVLGRVRPCRVIPGDVPIFHLPTASSYAEEGRRACCLPVMQSNRLGLGAGSAHPQRSKNFHLLPNSFPPSYHHVSPTPSPRIPTPSTLPAHPGLRARD